MSNERTVTYIEKMFKLRNENDGSFIGAGDINAQTASFAEGHAMFIQARLGQAAESLIREMEQEYGIIPTPKLNEEQKQYFSGVHKSGTVLCVPKSCPESMLEAVGVVLETLNGEAHRTYMDAFIKSALKTKYSRGSMTGQCIDLILDGLAKNTLREYPNYCGNIIYSAIFSTFLSDPGNFASNYASVIDTAQTTWNAAIASLQDAIAADT